MKKHLAGKQYWNDDEVIAYLQFNSIQFNLLKPIIRWYN